MEIIKCRFDFSPVAKGEPDPCREPLPRKSRYDLGDQGRRYSPPSILRPISALLLHKTSASLIVKKISKGTRLFRATRILSFINGKLCYLNWHRTMGSKLESMIVDRR